MKPVFWAVRLTREETGTCITRAVHCPNDDRAIKSFFNHIGVKHGEFYNWTLTLTPITVRAYNRMKAEETLHVPS